MSHVALLPYELKAGRKLADVSLDALHWPLGAPDDLSGNIGDLGPDDHLIVYPGSRLYYMPRFGVRCKVSVMIVEPEAVHGRHMLLLRQFHRRFHKVLTCNRKLLSAIPNGVFFTFGSTWVRDADTLDRTKSKTLSLIASSRKTYEGHQLRHEIVDWLRNEEIEADIMGRGYRPFERKSDGLAPYRYSVIIENVREPSHFTEKLIDCLLCDTIPIYWGAPDIGDFFDVQAMLICESASDIKAAITGLSETGYENRRSIVMSNRELAKRYADHEYNAAHLLKIGRMPFEEIA